MPKEAGKLARRLAEFFAQIANYELLERPKPSSANRTSTERLGALFASWRDPLFRARETAFTNPWTTAGLGQEEVRICSVLASLWDRNRYGAEGRAFLSRFLQAIEGVDDEIDLSQGYRIQTEHCLNGSIKDRVDITIETRTAIIGVEVKIHASERDAQLSDYSKAIATRAALMRRERYQVIFLSPYSSRYEDHTVPHMTWTDLSELAATADASSHTGWLIQQFGEFCRNLGR